MPVGESSEFTVVTERVTAHLPGANTGDGGGGGDFAFGGGDGWKLVFTKIGTLARSAAGTVLGTHWLGAGAWASTQSLPSQL